MLQQTRVDTVVPYYERFLSRFPTAHDLAAAEPDEVMSLWSGLGYYRRARLLHQGVKEVVAEYGGLVPESAADRRSLPGVGRYTAGAIGSIAFGHEEPVVDGNVSRVLSRLFCIEGALGSAPTERALWAKAGELVQGKRPGALNQAVMELGATVCTARDPDCTDCPVRKRCAARKTGTVDRFPVAKKRKRPREVRAVAVIATHGRPPRLWLHKSETPLFGGLWGVPLTEVQGKPSLTDARALLRSVALRARLRPDPVAAVTHTLTHRHYNVTIFRASGATGEDGPVTKCCTPDSLYKVGVSRLTHKILEHGLSAAHRSL